MANKITNTEHYAAIANAIRSKNGETDTYTPAEMADAIGRIPKGGGGASEGDVTFYDYDGTVVASYTAAQFAALEEMPENPDHTDEGLTSQGWNWSFGNAKAYVAKYGKLNVGQMYVPTDGKTHVFINIPEDDPSYETTLYFGHTTASGQTVVDWGDGSPPETFSGKSTATHSHTYSSPGKYEVTLDTTSGVMSVIGTSSSKSGTHFSGAGNYARNLTRIEEIRFSTNTSIGNYAFSYCYTLQSVTIPDSVTSIGNSAFSACYVLQSVTIPDSVTSIGDGAFYNCYVLQSVTIPDSVTSIGSSVFNACYALQSVTIPDSVTNIGNYALSACYVLQSVTIPDGVTRIGSGAFNACYALQSVTIPDSVTSIGNSAFSACYVLQSVTIPDSVTSIGDSAFYNCYVLQSVTIPDGVTTIGSSVFYNCYALQSVTIPDSVTSISNSAFNSCYAIVAYYFNPSVPPTLSYTNTFNSISTDTVFYVPAASLEAYKTANNWSTYANRMVAEPE